MAGNSLESWRRSIGNFNSGSTKLYSCPSIKALLLITVKILFTQLKRLCLSKLTLILIRLVIELLLLSAGIEPNPGPSNDGKYTNQLRILHTNLNGYSESKVEELRELSTHYDIIALTETKLTHNNYVNTTIAGFTLLTRNRGSSTRGGGVAMYIRDSLTFKRHMELESEELELLWLEITSMNETCMMAVCYRPPSSPVEFWMYLDETMGKFEDSYNCSFLLMGDLNADPNSQFGRQLDNFCSAHSLTCHINEPTRISSVKRVIINPETGRPCINPLTGCEMTTYSSTSTILDQFITKETETAFSNFEVLPPLNRCDHCAIACNVNMKANRPRGFKNTSWRWSGADFISMRHYFLKINWTDLFDGKSLDQMVLAFNSKLLHCLKQYCPQATYVVRENNCEWYTGELRFLKRKCNRLFGIFKRTRSHSDYEKYKQAQKCYDANLTSTKNEYFKASASSIHQQRSSNPRKWWMLTKKLLGLNKTSLTPPLQNNHGEYVTNASMKANIFNEHFASFSQLPEACNALPIPDNSTNKFTTFVVTLQDVEDQLKNLKNTNSVGSDGIPSRVLKECASSLAPGLLLIIQQSFQDGFFPSQWKEANVTPIFKKGDRSSPTNYRPISLLSISSKIIERVAFRQMFNFIRDNNLLYKQQSGFIPGDSCSNQLVYLYDNIVKAMEYKKQVKFIFCDITKAFDRVWHTGLLHKLSNFGFHGLALRWLTHYLTNRKQRVVLENQTSDWSQIHAGVPQGSVLGPLLFLLYINDLPKGLSSGVSMFADDTCLYIDFNRDDYTQRQEMLQQDIKKIEDWSKQWLVTFNPKKTNALVVHSRQSVSLGLPTSILNNNISQSNSHKHLGLTIGQFGNWNDHINDICTRARRKANMLRPLKYKLNRQTLLVLANSFVRPTLEYGCVVWDNCTKTEKMQIDRTYEDVLRIVCGAPSGSCRKALYKDTNQLSLQTRRDRSKLIQMHQLVHRTCPMYMSDMVEVTSEAREGRQFDTNPLLHVVPVIIILLCQQPVVTGMPYLLT